MIVVATDEEYKLAKKRFKRHIIVKTGVGGINVYKRLKHFPKWLKITNFGYVGSNIISKGTEVMISECSLYHPNVEYEEEKFKLKNGFCKCYTSNDFVLATDLKEPVVFDMELAYIMAMGFKKVESIKIVSDNLNLVEYENEIKEMR